MIKYLVNNNDLVEIYSDLLISHLYKKEEYGKTSDSDGNEVVVYTLATHHDPFSAVIFRVIVKHDADHFYTFNIYTDSLKKEYNDLDVGTPFLNNFNKRLSNFSQRLMKCFSGNSELSKLGFIKGFKDLAINFPFRYRSQVLYTKDLGNLVEYLYPKSYYDILALAMSEGKLHPNIKLSQIVLDNNTYTLMTCEKPGDLSKVIPKDIAIKIIQLWDKNKRLHDLEGFVDNEKDGNEFEKLLESCGLNDDKYAEYSAPEIVEACRSIASK